jgi:regulator of cell morphogenesis and NO signaling
MHMASCPICQEQSACPLSSHYSRCGGIGGEWFSAHRGISGSILRYSRQRTKAKSRQGKVLGGPLQTRETGEHLMSIITTAMPLGEIASLVPEATGVFETFGIDYCCGGKTSLEHACATSKISPQNVLQSIQLAQGTIEAGGQKHDWLHEPLAALIAHIKSTHHKYTREQIARLLPILDKVHFVHTDNHPELQLIYSAFEELSTELIDHMIDEEIVLFPYIVRMEQSDALDDSGEPSVFGTLGEPLATMVLEHDSAGDKLRAIRQASGGFIAPADACTTYRSTYRALGEFETYLHQHIHRENNILFPRAIALEQKRSRTQ